MCESDKYEYVKVLINGGCNLSWRYKISGSVVEGSDMFGESVGDYTDKEIIKLTVDYLGVKNPECIKVFWD